MRKNSYNFHKKIRIGRKKRKEIVVGIIILIAIFMLFYPAIVN